MQKPMCRSETHVGRPANAATAFPLRNSLDVRELAQDRDSDPLSHPRNGLEQIAPTAQHRILVDQLPYLLIDFIDLLVEEIQRPLD
jgi:hypothetical protein